MTQVEKILNILKDEDWHCVNEFIDTYCVDYRRRLVDLKKQGYKLISRKCEKHNHNGGSKEWMLIKYDKQIREEGTEQTDPRDSGNSGQSMFTVQPSTISGFAHIPQRSPQEARI